MIERRNFLAALTTGLAAIGAGTQCGTSQDTVQAAAQPVTWTLWPGTPPGEITKLPPEADTTGPDGKLVAGRRVVRLGNVSIPTITVYKPDPAVDTRAAVVVAPGGGFNILAMDLEGTEVAVWLNAIGVTAIVLKYRVPGKARDPERRWLCAVQDAQRAMGMVRGRAREIGIDPTRIGLMGFSAGAVTATLTTFITQRLYDPVDEYDRVACRPDFVAPIYGAGTLPEGTGITGDAPPFFFAIAHDDKDRSVPVAEFYIALKKAGASAELHIYSEGGHGYGLRRTELPVTSWHDRMEDWMRHLKLLEQ